MFTAPRRASPAGAIPSDGAVAQLGERYNGIVEVRGSIPLGSTIVPDAGPMPARCRPSGPFARIGTKSALAPGKLLTICLIWIFDSKKKSRAPRSSVAVALCAVRSSTANGPANASADGAERPRRGNAAAEDKPAPRPTRRGFHLIDGFLRSGRSPAAAGIAVSAAGRSYRPAIFAIQSDRRRHAAFRPSTIRSLWRGAGT